VPLATSAIRKRWYLLFAAAVIALEYALARFEPSYALRAVLAVILAFTVVRVAWGTEWVPTYGNVRASLRLSWKVVLWFFAILAGVFAVAVILIRANDWRFDVVLLNVPSYASFWPWAWLAVVQAPVFEEIVYRGVLYPALRQGLGRWPAILVNAVLFWGVHWIYWGGVTPPNHLAAGILFAWVYDRTRSLLAPTLLHALGNLWIGLGDVAWLTWHEHFEALLGWS
jgi:membrane protease YdiL (CAAX protease family)